MKNKKFKSLAEFQKNMVNQEPGISPKQRERTAAISLSAGVLHNADAERVFAALAKEGVEGVFINDVAGDWGDPENVAIDVRNAQG